jgi:hypothetical protein
MPANNKTNSKHSSCDNPECFCKGCTCDPCMCREDQPCGCDPNVKPVPPAIKPNE